MVPPHRPVTTAACWDASRIEARCASFAPVFTHAASASLQLMPDPLLLKAAKQYAPFALEVRPVKPDGHV